MTADIWRSGGPFPSRGGHTPGHAWKQAARPTRKYPFWLNAFSVVALVLTGAGILIAIFLTASIGAAISAVGFFSIHIAGTLATKNSRRKVSPHEWTRTD